MVSPPRTIGQSARLWLIALAVVAFPIITQVSEGLRAQAGPPSITVASGFAVTTLGKLTINGTDNVSLAAPPPHLAPAFGGDLYAAVSLGLAGAVYRLAPNGSATLVAANASLPFLSAEFPPAGSAFQPSLHLSQLLNIAALNASGLIPLGVPPAQYVGLAFPPVNGSPLYAADPTGRVHSIFPSGLTDETESAFLLPFDLAFSPAGFMGAGSGASLFATVEDINNGARSIAIVNPAAGTFTPFLSLAGAMAIEFGRGGSFGDAMYVGDGDGQIWRVTHTAAGPQAAVFGSGFGIISYDGLEFSHDGKEMYVADQSGIVYRIVDEDADDDGVLDDVDNCPSVANADQADHDGDGTGDACDVDDDDDGVNDGVDNCPLKANPDQFDHDGDGQGNACDVDDDADGVNDGVDNCPLKANPDQFDHDGDGQGDACDVDDDDDGIIDGFDNCPLKANTDQNDHDADGVGDACDPDDDNDGVADAGDNCPLKSNADQLDTDGDGQGDACDADDDNDTVLDGADGCPLQSGSPANNGCPLVTIGALTQLVESTPSLKPAFKKPMLATLKAAEHAASKGLKSAPVLMRVFIAEVELAKRLGRIAPAAADAIIAGAQQILIGL